MIGCFQSTADVQAQRQQGCIETDYVICFPLLNDRNLYQPINGQPRPTRCGWEQQQTILP